MTTPLAGTRPRVDAIDTLIRVEQVDNAEHFIGDLFRRRFHCDAPDFPAHFVAFYKASPNCFIVLGYVHYTATADGCMCGGLVEDERAMKRMPASHQALVRDAGGITAKLLRDTQARFADQPAVWACSSEAPVRETFFRTGFTPVDDSYILVKWNGDGTTAEAEARLRRIKAIGPF